MLLWSVLGDNFGVYPEKLGNAPKIIRISVMFRSVAYIHVLISNRPDLWLHDLRTDDHEEPFTYQGINRSDRRTENFEDEGKTRVRNVLEVLVNLVSI